MPTLNLGRVRFNWKGAYDPLEAYVEYDCVEDDGQSYVCIAPVTGTGPNDAGASTYWESMLVRSADYNQARDDAIAAASSAETSATEAGNSATAASDSETAAGNSETKAEQWAEEAEDVEVETGKFSAKHWATKAQNFGDPNLLSVTADQTADERQLKDWMAQLLTTQQTANSYQDQIDDANNTADSALSTSQQNASDIGDNATAISANQAAINNLKSLTGTAFWKADGSQSAWTTPTATTVETASAITAVVDGLFVQVAAGSVVALPTLSPGTDYFIYLASDGSLQAVDADVAPPAGERLVGGFHCRAGDGEINPYSFWDLNWRPRSYPRAMTLSIDGRVWFDIYLMDHEYTLYGYSRNGVQIADDGNRPIIPDIFGGDGTTRYGSASWWSFNDVLNAHGKRYPFYQEFTAGAYGVVERQAVGTDPVTTQHQAGHRSVCGCEQITGVMWQWGSDITGYGSGWINVADGRGDVYASWIRSPLIGAYWDDGSYAGSRASYWVNSPSNSHSGISARGVSDHLNLQAER